MLNSGRVIPGYGHAVLRKTDPRFSCQVTGRSLRPVPRGVAIWPIAREGATLSAFLSDVDLLFVCVCDGVWQAEFAAKHIKNDPMVDLVTLIYQVCVGGGRWACS